MREAVVSCECGYHKVFTPSNSFSGDVYRSAEQAVKGHCSGTECDQIDVDIDATEIESV